jgi:hypothetical protein
MLRGGRRIALWSGDRSAVRLHGEAEGCRRDTRKDTRRITTTRVIVNGCPTDSVQRPAIPQALDSERRADAVNAEAAPPGVEAARAKPGGAHA